MQQHQMDVKSWNESNLHLNDGREDNECVAENHRHDKSYKNDVQHRIVIWTCILCAA